MGEDSTTDTDGGIIQRVVSESRLVTELERVDTESSRVISTGKRAIQGSWLYQWLTKEPEPEVIVIDLRETRTVGPIIRLLDWTLETVQPYWEGSALKRLTDATGETLERAADTRTGRLLAALLAPPEPPERESETRNNLESDSETTSEAGDASDDESGTSVADESFDDGESVDAEDDDENGDAAT